jgi:hypothetical protein
VFPCGHRFHKTCFCPKIQNQKKKKKKKRPLLDQRADVRKKRLKALGLDGGGVTHCPAIFENDGRKRVSPCRTTIQQIEVDKACKKQPIRLRYRDNQPVYAQDVVTYQNNTYTVVRTEINEDGLGVVYLVKATRRVPMTEVQPYTKKTSTPLLQQVLHNNQPYYIINVYEDTVELMRNVPTISAPIDELELQRSNACRSTIRYPVSQRYKFDPYDWNDTKGYNMKETTTNNKGDCITLGDEVNSRNNKKETKSVVVRFRERMDGWELKGRGDVQVKIVREVLVLLPKTKRYQWLDVTVLRRPNTQNDSVCTIV